jgi:hypothetical protein
MYRILNVDISPAIDQQRGNRETTILTCQHQSCGSTLSIEFIKRGEEVTRKIEHLLEGKDQLLSQQGVRRFHSAQRSKPTSVESIQATRSEAIIRKVTLQLVNLFHLYQRWERYLGVSSIFANLHAEQLHGEEMKPLSDQN